jgi:type I restriction enzyme S subunit
VSNDGLPANAASPVLVPLGDVVSLSSGDFINAADYKSGDGDVTVVGAGGPMGKTARAANALAPAVIIGRVGAAGATYFFRDPVFATDNTLIAEPKDSVRPKFLYHFLRSVDWPSLQSGSSQPLINQRTVKGLEIPRLGLEDQDRITHLIDALEESRQSAQLHLGTARQRLLRLRRAISAAACSGRLTADWRSDHDDSSGGALAEELSVLNGTQRRRRSASRDELEDLREYPETWGVASFGALTINHDGRRIPVKSADRARRQGRYPYYGASGVIDEIDDFLFEGDYLLISEDGANLLARSTPIAFRASGRFWVNNHAHVVQGQPGIVDAYLEIVINGRDIQMHVTGSAQPKLTQGALNAISVPVPSTAEQHEIVRRVMGLTAVADRIDSRIEAAAKHIERNSQAVLAKAFRGELLTPIEGPHERASNAQT